MKKRIRRIFFTGLFTVLPLALTVYLIYWLISSLDDLLRVAITSLLGFYVPGLGFFSIIILIFLVGLFANNIIGRWLIRQSEKILGRLPIVKNVYGSISDIQKTFTNNPTKQFSQVVLIDYPLEGTKSMGFIAREDVKFNEETKVSVFVPTTPNPTNGFLLFLPRDKVQFLDIRVDVAIKMIVSMGTFQPEEITPETKSTPSNNT